MSWYSEIVQPGFVLASSVAGSFITLAALADKIARPEVKANLVKTLGGSWDLAIPAFWQSFMQSVFGRRRLGLRALLVTCLFSVTLCIFLNIQHAWSNPACAIGYAQPQTWLSFILVAFSINGIGDFFSVAKTRYIVDCLIVGKRSALAIAALVALDLGLGVLLFVVSFVVLQNFYYIFYLWDLSAFVDAMRINEIRQSAYVLTTELRDYGVYLSGTNKFTTGAYLYTSIAMTFWGMVLFVPLMSIALAQAQYFVSRQFRAFWNVKSLPFTYFGVSVGSLIFVVVLSIFLLFGTLAKITGGGPGKEIGCECSRSCSIAVP